MRKAFTRDDDNWGFQNFGAAAVVNAADKGYVQEGCLLLGVTRATDAAALPWRAA